VRESQDPTPRRRQGSELERGEIFRKKRGFLQILAGKGNSTSRGPKKRLAQPTMSHPAKGTPERSLYCSKGSAKKLLGFDGGGKRVRSAHSNWKGKPPIASVQLQRKRGRTLGGAVPGHREKRGNRPATEKKGGKGGALSQETGRLLVLAREACRTGKSFRLSKGNLSNGKSGGRRGIPKAPRRSKEQGKSSRLHRSWRHSKTR